MIFCYQFEELWHDEVQTFDLKKQNKKHKHNKHRIKQREKN